VAGRRPRWKPSTTTGYRSIVNCLARDALSRNRAVDVTTPVLRAATARWRCDGVRDPTVFARVRALLRRKEREEAVGNELLIGNTNIDLAKRTVTRGGTQTALSEKEAGILQLLAAHRGETVSREKFLDVVWGYHAYPSTRTVDNFIAGLRAKLEDDPANPRHLLTVRGTGYRLEV
jgi:DNA-binding winged helix-turn-helix (wHTH) protein